MGWLFGHKSREELVASRVENDGRRFHLRLWTRNGDRAGWYTSETLAHKLVGNCLWKVVRVTVEYAVSETAPVTETKVETAICLDLIEKQDGVWGYKDMCESSHPYFYSCPRKYLTMAPVACEEWRKGVREYHALTNAKFNVGDVLVLKNGCEPSRLTVVTARPLTARSAGGVVFKVPRKMIDRVEPAVAGGVMVAAV